MKIIYNHKITVVFLSVLLFSVGKGKPALCQETQEKERTRLKLSYEKLFNGEKKIITELTSGGGKNAKKLAGAPIVFSFFANDSIVELEPFNTNMEGVAELIIMPGFNFPVDEDGFTSISASFEGNEQNRPSSNEITVKDVHIDIQSELVDSVKTVSLTIFETDPEGNKVPVEAVSVIVSVERLFTNLQIGEIQSDVDGTGIIEFPDDLPGDSLGILRIVARIEDNEYYGTVENRTSVSWGLPVSYEVKPLPRQLWTDEAPLWMIISVFLVLAAAWFHFFVAVNRVLKIRKADNELSA